ncbi:hypothetical protein J437_LFUL000677 [Ladona fulva]|uniref:M-phase phosphoprotein 6 n=1 Tax=Ladona fulva TaxID=123851 RepID=A0A8K0K4K6_LADFU|nr:hypothetical protein J437_LFUL000677 [Ladona fulva]
MDKHRLKMDFRSATKRKLSKNILEMKFMKRSKEKAEKEKEDEERQIMFSHEITPGMKESNYVLEPSFIPCEDLILGRLSYHGFNPVVERMMQERIDEEESKARVEKAAAERRAEKDVSDEEMAWKYGTLSGTISRKFKNGVVNNDERTNPSKRRMDKDPKYTWTKSDNVNSYQESENAEVKRSKFLKPE